MIEFGDHPWHDLAGLKACPDHCVSPGIIAAMEERAGWAYHDCRHDPDRCPAARCVRARAEVRDPTHRTNRPLAAPNVDH